jgi:Fe-S cluster biosynthesis and repair protein YggX
MPDRIVHCFLLKKDLPGLDRAPFRNELGQRIFNEISKEAWQQWLKDSVKFINTYRVDLASSEGQTFMAKQCAVYFGFEKGEVAATAWTPGSPGEDPAKKAPGREGHDESHGEHGKE